MTECIDTSIAVKWFHKGESFENEANLLLQRIIELEGDFAVNELLLLEVVRAGGEEIHMQKESLNGLFRNHLMEVKSLKDFKE